MVHEAKAAHQIGSLPGQFRRAIIERKTNLEELVLEETGYLNVRRKKDKARPRALKRCDSVPGPAVKHKRLIVDLEQGALMERAVNIESAGPLSLIHI